eukprot:g20462.t1
MLISSIASSNVPQQKNRNDLLTSQTQEMNDTVPFFIIQYFPRAVRLCRVLCSLQHIDDNEHLAKIILTPPLLAFKQPANLKQTIVRSKLPSLQDNIDHNTTQSCHGNICKTCQIINMETPPTTCMANTHVIRPTLSISYTAGKDAPRRGILAKPCRRYGKGTMDTMHQSPDRNVPCHLGNTSVVKDIQRLIF